MNIIETCGRSRINPTRTPGCGATAAAGPLDHHWLSARLRGISYLLVAMLIAACGGGGGGGGGGAGGVAGTLAALEVTPGSATVAVGATAQYSVVARDATGLVIATPPLTWVSGSKSVGSIDSAGLAAGVSPGQTPITAAAGSVVSPAAVLNVVQPSACDSIQSVPQWTANLDYGFSDSITTPAGATLSVAHYVTVQATLTPLGVFQDKVSWVGQLAIGPFFQNPPPYEPFAIRETFDDQVSDPTFLGEVRGNGGPIPAGGVDGFRLEVDLSNCTFRFYAATAMATTLTRTIHAVRTLPGSDEGTFVFKQNTDFGLLQKGITPLGNWRTAGLGDYSSAPQAELHFNSYSVAATIPDTVDAYIPAGIFAQGLYNPLSPAPRQDVYMVYGIKPQP